VGSPETDDVYLGEVKRFLLDNFSELFNGKGQKEIFMKMDAQLPPEITNKVNPEVDNETFVNNLVNACSRVGVLKTGQHSLIAVLDGVSKRVQTGEWKKISQMKAVVISNEMQSEQAYVSLIADCELNSYMPWTREDLVANKLITESNPSPTFYDVCKRINELSRDQLWGRRKYPYFNIDPWLHCTCEDLQDWYKNVASHFGRYRFLGIIVDSSIVTSSQPCQHTLGQVLQLAIEKQNIGIACIINKSVGIQNIPEEYYELYESTLQDISSLKIFLLSYYNKWKGRNNTESSGARVIAGVGPN
jgi:hypothetical protein